MRFLLRQTQAEVQRIAGTTSSVERQVTQGFRNITASIAPLQGGLRTTAQLFTQLLTVAASFGGINLARQAIQLGDSIADMARQVGASIEGLQRLRIAAELNGSSAEQLDRALNVLNERLGEAGRGSKEAQQAFADLGLNWRDLQRIGVEQSFLVIADALSRFENQADRAARQGNVLGDRSRALANVLSLTSQGIQEASTRFERFGGVLSEDVVRSLADTNDTLTELSRLIQSRLAVVVARITPDIIAWAESFERVIAAVTGNTEALLELTSVEAAVVNTLQSIAAGAQVVGDLFIFIRDGVRNLIANFELKPLGDQIEQLDTQIRTLEQNLTVLRRAPAEEANTAAIERQTDRLRQLLAIRQRLNTEALRIMQQGGAAPPPAPEQPETLPPVTVTAPRVPIRQPFQANVRTAADLLTDEARRAAGAFTSWSDAIQSIEREIRNLEPVAPIVKNLDEAARNASGTFTTWLAAITALEQDVRRLPPEVAALNEESQEASVTFRSWAEAIQSIEQEVRSTVTTLSPFAQSLNEAFQTPLERLQEFQRQLAETQELLAPGVAARALQDAQVEFARTTVLGQSLVVVADGIGDAFEQSFQGIVQGTLSVSQAFRNLAQSILASISRILIQRGVTALLNVALSALAPSAGLESGASEILMKQQGGLVPGPRGAGDSVPALLAPGEFVVRRAAVDAIGKQTLSRLNALGMQQGGLVPAFLSPGEFVVKRQAAEILGATTLAKINAMGYQQGGPVVPPVAHTANNRMDQGVTINNIVVRSDAEAQAKRQELEALDGHIVNVINRQILGGDGSLINRSLSMVRGGR